MFALIGSHGRDEPVQITGLPLAMNVPPLAREDNCVIVLEYSGTERASLIPEFV